MLGCSRTCARAWCVLLVAVCAGGISPSAARAWTPRLNLTRGAGDAGAGVGSVDATGRVHLLVGRSGQQLWWLLMDNQVQAAWTQIASSGAVSPNLSPDAAGRMHAFYSQGFEIRHQLWTSAAGWSADTVVSGNVGGANRPHSCIDSAGNLHVVWNANNQIWYNRRVAATGLWDTAIAVPGADDQEFYFSPRVGAVGTSPVIVYGKHNGGNWTAWFASRESGTWVNTLLDGSGGCSNGDIAVSPDGTIDVAWDRGYDVYHRRRVSGVWQPLANLRVGGNDSLGPRLSAITSSNVRAIWRENSDLLSSDWSGSAWGGTQSVTTGGGGVGGEIFHDASGRHFATWSKDWDIWLATSTPLSNPPPPSVSGLSPTVSTSRVRLTWTNPSAYDLSRLKIVWRTDRAPAGPADGTIVLDKSAAWGMDSFTHEPIANGLTHYYAVCVTDATGQTSPLAQTSARPTLSMDFDDDGDVDQSDYGHLQVCFTGTGAPITNPLCFDADLDTDGFAGPTDLARFLACFTGPDIRPDDACAN